jgi:DNA invertase Pin-like site-specific DNA recombinase
MNASGDGTPKRVALYMRVSTDEQYRTGYSIPDQRRTLHDHAERLGWRVVEKIVDDGYSGASPTVRACGASTILRKPGR